MIWTAAKMTPHDHRETKAFRGQGARMADTLERGRTEITAACPQRSGEPQVLLRRAASPSSSP
jgi:hypothetical protein